MRSGLRRRLAGAVVAAVVGTITPVALAPAASASEQAVYAEACPEGYKGVIVGTTGGTEFYACTNILP